MVCAASQCEAVEVCQPSDSAVVFFFFKGGCSLSRRHASTSAYSRRLQSLVTTWMQKVLHLLLDSCRRGCTLIWIVLQRRVSVASVFSLMLWEHCAVQGNNHVLAWNTFFGCHKHGCKLSCGLIKHIQWCLQMWSLAWQPSCRAGIHHRPSQTRPTHHINTTWCPSRTMSPDTPQTLLRGTQ